MPTHRCINCGRNFECREGYACQHDENIKMPCSPECYAEMFR